MKFSEWLEETTTTAGIEQPLAKGKVDVVGAGCPEGYKWDKDLKECVPTGKVSEYQEIHRTDRYDEIAKSLIKNLRGKKKVSFREIEQAIIDEFTPYPFDRYDHQEVVDRLKEKKIKVESTSPLREAMKIDILVVIKNDKATGKPVDIRELQKEYESTSGKKLPKTVKAGKTWVVNFGRKDKDVWGFETFLDTIGVDYDTVED